MQTMFKGIRLMTAGALVATGVSILQAGEKSLSVEDYRKAEAKIKAAVEAGKVSREDAEKKLGEMRRMVRADGARTGGRGLSAEDYRRAEKRMKAGVESGKITREEAEKRMAEMRRRMQSQKQGPRPAGTGREVELKKKFHAAERKIMAAVEAGKISKEEGKKKLMEVGKSLRRAGGNGGGKEAEMKTKFRAAEEEIWKAVKAGKLSEEEGKKKLGLMKEEMFRGPGKAGRGGSREAAPGIEKLKREVESLRRENEGLRKRLEKERRE